MEDSFINILLARPYINQQTLDIMRWTSNSIHINLLIDCGAFTDFMAGKPIISVEQYMDWLDEIFEKLDFAGLNIDNYLALDVIGNPALTIDNLEKMLRKGYNPIGVVTRGMSDDEISRIGELCEYVAIGGIGGMMPGTLSSRIHFLRKAQSLLVKNKIHWLAFTDPQFVRHYSVASFDSSNFYSAQRYGRLRLYYGNFKYGRTLKYGHGLTSTESRLIRSLGVDPVLLSNPLNWRLKDGYCLSQCVEGMMQVRQMLDWDKYGVKSYFSCSSWNRGGPMNLIYYLIHKGKRCIGQPQAKLVYELAKKFDKIQDITPENSGCYCKHL